MIFLGIADINKWLQEYDQNDESRISEEENSDDSDKDCDEDNDDKINQPEDNLFNAVTCLLPEEPLSDVIGKWYKACL